LIGVKPVTEFDADTFLQSPRSGFLTSTLEVDTYSLLHSIPLQHLLKSNQAVEELSLRIGPDGKPVGVSIALKQALGSPLMKNMVTRSVHPVIAPGPVISVKDAMPATTTEEAEESPENEPSFLRKYWWIIVGAMLLSSVFGPNDNASGQGAGSGSSNNK